MVQPDKYLMSCMLRAAHKTIKGFTQQTLELLDMSTDSHLLSDLNPNDSLGRSATPHGWDSNALCLNLYNMADKYPLLTFTKV